MTNPPYSADHVEKCLTFAAANLAEHGRPYFLLLPSYVIHKPYYVDALLTGGAAGRRAKEAREKIEREMAEEKEEDVEEEEEEEEDEEEDDEEDEEDGEEDEDIWAEGDEYVDDALPSEGE